MKIYTRTGDSGQTGLYGGERVAKTSRRVEAYGTVDEANSAIGLARAELPGDADLDATLASLQDGLFDVGADLATPHDATQSSKLSRIDSQDVERLEALIDLYDAEVAPLQHFIHPGGTRGASALHLGRAVARRAEREVLRLEGEEQTNHEVVRYLNRLSDLLFVLARVANARAGTREEGWRVRGRERQ